MGTGTILVTGGTGTVGRALVATLANNPTVRVRVLTRNPTALELRAWWSRRR